MLPRLMEPGMKHLIIPDSHAHPDFDNERFKWLGKFIMDERPDVIIDLGDGPDMPSLSSYDRGKGSFEGRRVLADISCYLDSQEKLLAPLRRYNKMRAKNKKNQYKPRLVKLGGNHDEGRIDRVANDSPELQGFLSIDQLKHKEFGWEYHPYLSPAIINGVAYSHFFPSGVMGRPIGGENAAATLIKKNLMSSVAGHAHTFDHAERSRADGQKLFGLVAGCYLHPQYGEQGWCRAVSRMWWNGVVVLDAVREGYYWGGMTLVTRTELEARYA